MATKTKKKKLTAAEQAAIDKEKRTMRLILGGIFGFILVVGACVFLYTSMVESSRRENTERGIELLAASQYREAEALLKIADKDGETYASEFLAWLYASGGYYSQAEYYAKRAISFNRLSSFEVLGDLALLNIGEQKGVHAALAFFKHGASALAADQGKRIRAGEQSLRRVQSTNWYRNDPSKLSNQEIAKHSNYLFSQMVQRAIPIVSNENDFSELIMGAVRLGAQDLDMPLGDMLFLGTDRVASNIEVAIKHWQSALDKGDNSAVIRLAGAAWHGYAQNRDPQNAIDLYNLAAEQNKDPVALYALGLITLRLPNSNLSSNNQAVQYFTRASELGYGPASTALGVLAMTETNSELSAVRAAQWLKIAAQDQKDIAGRILYDLMLMSGAGVPMKFTEGFDDIVSVSLSFQPAEAIIDLLQKRVPPVDVLRQAMILSNQVLHGQIAWREGDPVSITEIEDKETGELLPRPFTFYKSVTTVDNITLSRFGRNNFCPVTDLSKVKINGEPILDPALAKIILQYAPSTGTHHFVPDLKMPRPFPPMVPLHYNISDFVPPVGLLESRPFIDEQTDQRTKVF